MPERNPGGSKGRILFLRSWLLDHTDDEHVITTEELIALCKEHGYSANRNTLADDIAVLRSSGLDIITETVARRGTGTNGYHIGNRTFEQAELKLLMDAVSSSRFITEEKSTLLTEKLSLMTNEENRQLLTSRTFIADRLKTTNHNVLALIDTIFQAIYERRKVSFHYWDYTPKKERVLRHDGELYVASPFALVWNDDRYYMAAFSDKRKKIVNFRVDRMCDLEITNEQAVIDESFNPAEHSRKVMKMFDGDQRPRRITLWCQNPYMQNILDRFGEETVTKAVDSEHFSAIVTVCPSSTFFSWVMQFRGGILIQKPAEVKQKYEDMLRELLEKQNSADTSNGPTG